MELKLIPAQTGNGTMKMYTNCGISLSVDSLPSERKDTQLLIFSCAATQYVLLCVCLYACVSVLGFWYETFLYLEYSRIFRERERDIIS